MRNETLELCPKCKGKLVEALDQFILMRKDEIGIDFLERYKLYLIEAMVEGDKNYKRRL